jgi:hypothetical protein
LSNGKNEIDFKKKSYNTWKVSDKCHRIAKIIGNVTRTAICLKQLIDKRNKK